MTSTPIHLDHPLANSFQCKRPEFTRHRFTVQMDERPECLPKRLDFHRRRTIRLAIVGLRMFPKRCDDLVDRQRRLLRLRDGCTASIGQPLRDQAIIFRLTLLRTVFAEVVILTVEGDDGLPGNFVQAVLRNFSIELWHVRLLSLQGKTVHTVFLEAFRPHCPTQAGTQVKRSAILTKLGVAGLEPATLRV